MTLAGIEIRFLVDNISELTKDYYVSNIYGINRDSLLFKLHHPEKSDLLLMFSQLGIWFTSVKIEKIEQNRLLKRFRSDLLRLKLEKVEQKGAERIAYLTFGGFDKKFILIGEFFGDGNIVLCNSELKILAILHSVDVRHRQLKIGLTYTPPPQKGKDVFEIKIEDLLEILNSSLVSAKWLGRTLGFPTKYVEEIFKQASVDSKKLGTELTEEDVHKIHKVFEEILTKVTQGQHDPILVKDDSKSDVYPINLGEPNEGYEKIPSFMEGLDILFTKNIVEKGKDLQSTEVDKKIEELQTKLDEQNKAISEVKEKSNRIGSVAKSLMNNFSEGITSINESKTLDFLKKQNVEVIMEKGISLIKIDDKKIKIDLESSLPTIASSLFDESKKQSKAIAFIEKLKKKTEENLQKQRNQLEIKKDSVAYTEIRKKNWYERYRWFFTSDDFLAIGGRDSSSNSAIIRKHMQKDDKVFHADIHGSPFFLLKDRKVPIPPSTFTEVAHATVCFSRAWREAVYGLNAYWVEPSQIKKAAPSGQFLPKGSFVLEGQRNNVNVPSLKLAVAIIQQDQDFVVTCGPLDPIKKNSVCYSIIEPGGSEMVDIAKKIKSEFVRLKGDLGKKISLDEIVRALPAGTSSILESGIGNSSYE